MATSNFFVYRSGILGLGLALLVLSASCYSEPAPSEQKRAAARQYALNSVGRLTVPAIRYRKGYPAHFKERCSATLITPSAQPGASRLILSAWHCVEHYRDLSRAPIFEAANGRQSEARVLASGGSMHSDWVLLQLREPMQGAVSLPTRDLHAPQSRLLMAGYPREDPSDVDTTQTGDGMRAQPSQEYRPRSLETSESCEITGRLNRDPRSNCVLRKGASGGAVFSEDLNYTYLGVISQGDQATQSIFVPVARFRARISGYLEAQSSR